MLCFSHERPRMLVRVAAVWWVHADNRRVGCLAQRRLSAVFVGV